MSASWNYIQNPITAHYCYIQVHYYLSPILIQKLPNLVLVLSTLPQLLSILNTTTRGVILKLKTDNVPQNPSMAPCLSLLEKKTNVILAFWPCFLLLSPTHSVLVTLASLLFPEDRLSHAKVLVLLTIPQLEHCLPDTHNKFPNSSLWSAIFYWIMPPWTTLIKITSQILSPSLLCWHSQVNLHWFTPFYPKTLTTF